MIWEVHNMPRLWYRPTLPALFLIFWLVFLLAIPNFTRLSLQLQPGTIRKKIVPKP